MQRLVQQYLVLVQSERRTPYGRLCGPRHNLGVVGIVLAPCWKIWDLPE